MATREAIGIDKVEPYSKVIKAGGFIFVKSHIGYDYETGEYPPDIGGQTTNTLDHLERALQSAGSSIGAAVRVAVFLADIDRDFFMTPEEAIDYGLIDGIIAPRSGLAAAPEEMATV